MVPLGLIDTYRGVLNRHTRRSCDFTPSASDLVAISSVAHGAEGSSNCGGNKLAVCHLKSIYQRELGDWDPSNGAYALLGFCMIVLVSLVGDQSHAIMYPSSTETKPWFLEAYENSVVDLFSLRGFEFILVLASMISKSWRSL